MPSEATKSTYIYVISNGVQTKVGISNNVAKRLKSLQTGSATVLKLLREYKIGERSLALKLERQLHKMFFLRRCRHNGEWFDLSDSHIEVIDKWLRDILATI